MTDPITEINTATQQHFMPVVTNQIFLQSPILQRIFRASQEGKFGLALPSFDGRSIAEPLEIGEVTEAATTHSTGTCTAVNGDATVEFSSATLPTGITNKGRILILDDDASSKSYAILSRTDTDTLELTSNYEGTGATTTAYTLTYYADTSNASGAYGKSTTWGAGTGDVLGAADFAWKMYHNTLKIHNMDAEVNKGRERLFDIVALKMRNATRRLRKDLVSGFYADQADGGDAMVGLQAMVKATGLVGNIQKTKYGWWQGVTEDKSAALDWTVLNSMWYDTKKYGNEDPATLIVTSEGVLQKYEDDLSKVVVTGASGTRYPNVNLTVQADRMRKTFDGGFEGFSFKGIPMIADPLIPVSQKLFFINERYIHWRILKAFESTGWQQLRSQGKDWAQLTIFGYGALTNACCRKFGVITGLTEA